MQNNNPACECVICEEHLCVHHRLILLSSSHQNRMCRPYLYRTFIVYVAIIIFAKYIFILEYTMRGHTQTQVIWMESYIYYVYCEPTGQVCWWASRLARRGRRQQMRDEIDEWIFKRAQTRRPYCDLLITIYAATGQLNYYYKDLWCVRNAYGFFLPAIEIYFFGSVIWVSEQQLVRTQYLCGFNRRFSFFVFYNLLKLNLKELVNMSSARDMVAVRICWLYGIRMNLFMDFFYIAHKYKGEVGGSNWKRH